MSEEDRKRRIRTKMGSSTGLAFTEIIDIEILIALEFEGYRIKKERIKNYYLIFDNEDLISQ